MRQMPNRHTKTRLDVHQQGRSDGNVWLSTLPQISHYIQYCILDLDTECETDAWGSGTETLASTGLIYRHCGERTVPP